MPSMQERHRNNVRAGAFVAVSLVLMFSVILVLSEFWRFFEPTNTYTVAFPVETGVGFLAEGADVRVGGMPLGRVAAIEPRPGDTPLRTIDVTIRVDQRVALYPGARVVLNSALIGKEAWLEIPDLGDADVGPALGPDDPIAAADTTGFATALLGARDAERASHILADVQQTTSFLATLDQEYEKRVTPMLEDLQSLAQDSRELADELRHRDLPRWVEHIDRILAHGESGAETFDAMMGDGRAIADDVHEGVRRADGTLAEVDELVRGSRPSIEAMIEDLHAAGADVRDVADLVAREAGPIVERVEAFLVHGADGAELFADALDRLQMELDAELPGVREILANARLTSQQLKLTSIEVRRSPWKLLYRPSRSELEHELLYESARSFALAVSDLKAAAESVDRVMERHGDRLAEDPQAVDRLRDHLLDRFENYEQVQNKLLDVLFDERP